MNLVSWAVVAGRGGELTAVRAAVAATTVPTVDPEQ